MVGIIPKPIKKTPKLYEFAPHISFGLVVVVALVYVVLLYLDNKNSKTLFDLEEKITQVGTKDEKFIEAQLLADKQNIDDFAKLFVNHQKSSNFFKFLEENCHPKVWFGKLELSSKDSQAILTGETANFETLGQQMVLFQNNEFVKSVEITDLTIAKNGRASFKLSILLNPAIFQ